MEFDISDVMEADNCVSEKASGYKKDEYIYRRACDAIRYELMVARAAYRHGMPQTQSFWAIKGIQSAVLFILGDEAHNRITEEHADIEAQLVDGIYGAPEEKQ